MSEQENSSNVQAASSEAIPAATGPNVAELQAQLAAERAAKAELERQSEGRLRDLQSERAKRQELEQRVNAVPASSPATQPDVTNDELFNVVAPVIGKHPDVIAARQLIAEMKAKEQVALEDSAKRYLEEKTGKKFAALESDPVFQEKITAAARKYGPGANLYETTVKAYENMKRDEELEMYRAKAAEAEKARAASAHGTLPTGTPPAPVSGVKEFDVNAFNRLSTAEFDDMFANGSIRKVGDKIVYTPNR